MLKRYLLLLFFIPLLFPHPAFAQDESVTFTTYYPSPYGDYNNLTTNNFIARENVTLATEPGSRVGIGTTNPDSTLEVAGQLRVTNSGQGIINEITAPGHYNWKFGGSILVGNSFEIIPSTAANGFTFSTPAFVVLNNGNVGIGTTNPAGKLDVAGYVCMSGDCKSSWPSIPSGFCVFSRTQSNCPSGWTRDSGFDNMAIRGTSSPPGGTGGADNHAHTTGSLALTIAQMPSHSHSVNTNNWWQQGGALARPPEVGFSYAGVWYTNSAGGDQAHNHGNTGSSSSWPPYRNVIVCCKN